MLFVRRKGLCASGWKRRKAAIRYTKRKLRGARKEYLPLSGSFVLGGTPSQRRQCCGKGGAETGARKRFGHHVPGLFLDLARTGYDAV